ncbi:Flavin-containing monooxygenase FMO GS-OX-like 2-like [Homarus americanus]|uniref:Flavin-containing monooxygenase n=1 Tax=Homarus americanus TaxID=6706 RepID=A0A8J5JF44_HOMAM|nr:Flavin-containing monooxygenase FMO GS-OX-like 2-like [Homarus americanus]
MPPNIRQVPGVVKATQEGFEFADGSWAQANSILYCTGLNPLPISGYKYNFPFLMEECGIQVKDNCVKPLYKHLINSVYPSMALIGIPSRIIVFPIINYQVQYFIATLTGRVKLPTPEEMFTINHKIHKDWTEQGLQEKHFHMLNSDQWQYMDDLATEAGLVHPPPFLKKMWKIIMTRLFLSFPMFKGYDYSLNKDGTIVEARNGPEERCNVSPTGIPVVTHGIVLVNDVTPVKQVPYRMSSQKIGILNDEVQFLIGNNLAEPSDSERAFPCVQVPLSERARRISAFPMFNSLVFGPPTI